MALPKGKTSINTSNAPAKTPGGALPKGPERMPSKPTTPQGAGSTNKKGPGMPVGGKPSCG